MIDCVKCVIDGTDACPRGAGRAIDDERCDSFISNGSFISNSKPLDTNMEDAYSRGYHQGRADAIEEVIKAIDEQNYCMQEECHFNACRSEGCPINRNAEVIFQTWLKKLKEQKK